MALGLVHLEHYLLPQLALAGDFPDQVQRALDREAGLNPWIERLQWQTDGFLVLVMGTAPSAPAQDRLRTHGGRAPGPPGGGCGCQF